MWWLLGLQWGWLVYLPWWNRKVVYYEALMGVSIRVS